MERGAEVLLGCRFGIQQRHLPQCCDGGRARNGAPGWRHPQLRGCAILVPAHRNALRKTLPPRSGIEDRLEQPARPMRAVLCIRIALLLAANPASDAGLDADSEVSAVRSQARTYFADLLAQRIPEVVEKSEIPFYLQCPKLAPPAHPPSQWPQNLPNTRSP